MQVLKNPSIEVLNGQITSTTHGEAKACHSFHCLSTTTFFVGTNNRRSAVGTAKNGEVQDASSVSF